MKFKRLIWVICLLLAACATPKSEISVQNAWARPAQAGSGGASVTAVYLTIENHGDAADQLLSARTDAAAGVELHETRASGDIAGMHGLHTLEVPARSRLILRPGGYHLMLEGVTRDLQEGQTFTLTLKFTSGQQLDVQVTIQENAP